MTIHFFKLESQLQKSETKLTMAIPAKENAEVFLNNFFGLRSFLCKKLPKAVVPQHKKQTPKKSGKKTTHYGTKYA